LIGLYNATNISAALAIGEYFSVKIEQSKSAIEGYIPANNRSQIIHKGSNEILLDAYNANPSSMSVAIANFAQLSHPSKLMILGDMFELGEESALEHAALVQLVSQANIPMTYFVGPDFYAQQIQHSNMRFFSTYTDFELFFSLLDIGSSLILIKGSRGMALERVVELM
jgi:UDP-N-acetylmuramoyl-tripeptide--D-alanyl-D-alanine ligase